MEKRHIEIKNSELTDIDAIFDLYDLAADFQKAKGEVEWKEIEKEMVEEEIQENQQWKLLIDGQIACIWVTRFSDPEIWQEKDRDPAIYIHRIATNPKFRGEGLVAKIAQWSKEYAKSIDKKFVRMDTLGSNPSLISHYQKCGFEFLGIFKLAANDNLPSHYREGLDICLFEISVD